MMQCCVLYAVQGGTWSGRLASGRYFLTFPVMLIALLLQVAATLYCLGWIYNSTSSCSTSSCSSSSSSVFGAEAWLQVSFLLYFGLM
jgi:hypothetical protein